MKITSGIKGLLSSRNGTLAIYVIHLVVIPMLVAASVLAYFDKIDGGAFGTVCGVIAGIITTIAGIYTWTRAKGGSQ